MGKHRVYSLLLYKKYFKINKKFLFLDISNVKIWNNSKNNKLLFTNHIDLERQKHGLDLISFLLDLGDNLTPYLKENNCTPFPPFNDEKLFEEWLNTPIEELYGDIDI